MVLILLLTVNVLAQSTPATNSGTDHALAAKIERWFHDSVVNEDDSREVAKAKDLYERTGLPTLSQVGDRAAYESVVLLASDKLPMEFRRRVLVTVKEGTARQELPADAATFYEVRLHLEQLKQQAEAHPPSNPGLRDEIERMYKADQGVRQRKGFDPKKLTERDQGNAGPLRVILEKYGVPTYSMVGPQAAGDFVTMIQHQPAAFRQEALPQLKANVAKGEADPESYALVYDRLQRDLGKKQLYGEQLECNAGETLHEAPIKDAPQVNRRRAELGLIRMDLYAHIVKETMPQFCAPSAMPK
jgi:hypothetical protein